LCSTNASITGQAWTHRTLLKIYIHLKLNIFEQTREIKAILYKIALRKGKTMTSVSQLHRTTVDSI